MNGLGGCILVENCCLIDLGLQNEGICALTHTDSLPSFPRVQRPQFRSIATPVETGITDIADTNPKRCSSVLRRCPPSSYRKDKVVRRNPSTQLPASPAPKYSFPFVAWIAICLPAFLRPVNFLDIRACHVSGRGVMSERASEPWPPQ